MYSRIHIYRLMYVCIHTSIYVHMLTYVFCPILVFQLHVIAYSLFPSDVSWMDAILKKSVKVSKHKLRLLKQPQSISKFFEGLVYVGNIGLYVYLCLYTSIYIYIYIGMGLACIWSYPISPRLHLRYVIAVYKSLK